MPNWKKVITSGSDAALNSLQITDNLELTGSFNQTGSYNINGTVIISGSDPGQAPEALQVYGDMQTFGYHRFDPVTTNIDTSVSASYIYVSGSTDDLYFSQNGKGYNNVTRLRWLEGNINTGLLWGGVVSGSVGGTTIDVAEGEGIITTLNAFTGSEGPHPTINKVSWSDYDNVALTYLTTSPSTWLLIDSSGALVQQTSAPTANQFETHIQIGVVIHPNQTNISLVKTFTQTSYGATRQTFQFIRAFGGIKVDGHIVGDNGANLQLSRTSGTSFALGRNYAFNPEDPSKMEDPAATAPNIFYYYKESGDWVTTTGTSVINPNQYNEDGDGLSTVSNNKWTIQRIFFFPKSPNSIGVYYGRQEYSTLSDAQTNLSFEDFDEIDNTRQQAIFLGYLIVEKGATALNNTNTARFYQAGAFRTTGTGGGGGAPVVTNLEDLNDVAIAAIATGDLISWNGAEWHNTKTLDGNYSITGSLGVSSVITAPNITLTNVLNAGTDTDKFLVLDSSDNVDFRTGAQVLSDIGATSCVGTVTSVTAGAGMTQTGTSTINPTLNVIGGTAITVNANNIEVASACNTAWNAKTTCTGTVTSVGGTGTVSGITLSGTVTTSGNLTLGGTFSTTTSSITNFNSGVGTIVDGCGFTTCTGTVTGTGANNQVATWSGTNSLDSNSSFTYDGTCLILGGYSGICYNTADLILGDLDNQDGSVDIRTFGNTTSATVRTLQGEEFRIYFGGNERFYLNDTMLKVGASHILTGFSSTIAGGQSNTITDSCSFIGGGTLNTGSASHSFIGGGQGNTIADSANGEGWATIGGGYLNCTSCGAAAVLGGSTNYAFGCLSFIGGGFCNIVSEAKYGVIAGGCKNEITGSDTVGTRSFIGSGAFNCISSNYSTIVGGSTNTISSPFGFIGGGSTNSISTTACCSTIGGGYNNRVCANACWGTIGGGCSNYVSNDGGTIAGGRLHCNTGLCGFIGGGQQNYVQGQMGAVAGGYLNCARASCSFVGGGYSNDAFGTFSVVAGGYNNTNYENCSFIGGGTTNVITGTGCCHVIVGGGSNCIDTTGNKNTISGGGSNCILCNIENSTIAGGASNIICRTSGTDYGSFIGGGAQNRIVGSPCWSTIAGGTYNCTTSARTFIGGGTLNTGSGACSVIGGGESNYITSDAYGSTIAGGRGNYVGCFDGFIGGGFENTIDTNRQMVIVGGLLNSSTGDRSFIGGGRENLIESTGTLATLVGGYFNTGSAESSFIGGGCKNYIATGGSCSAILAGICNTACAANAFILGSNIITDMPDATYVQQVSYTGHTLGTAEFAGEVAAGLGTYAALSDGDLVYLNSSGQWNLTDADAASSSTGLIGIYLSSPSRVLLRGHARVTANSSFTGMSTIGAPLYVSTTAGDFTQTAPSATGDIVRIIGYVTDTTNDIMYFCPDNTWVEIS